MRSPRLQIVQGRNHGEWLFDGIHQSYAVVLLAASPQVLGRIQIGVARSPKDIAAMSDDTIVTFTPADLAALPETNVIPWFNQPGDRRVFDPDAEWPTTRRTGRMDPSYSRRTLGLSR